MSKLLKTSLSVLIGIAVGLGVAGWFDVQSDEAYYATVAIFGIIGAAVGRVVA